MEYSILKLINRPFLALQNLGGCHSEFLFNFDSKLAASPTEISCFRQCSGDSAIGEVLASLEEAWSGKTPREESAVQSRLLSDCRGRKSWRVLKKLGQGRTQEKSAVQSTWQQGSLAVCM